MSSRNVGTYKSVLSNDVRCAQCGTGASTSAIQSVDATACECIAGYEPDGSGGCKTCDVGYFKDGLSDTPCTLCASLHNSTTTLTTGANSSDLCVCVAGYGYVNGDPFTGCEPCEQGTYKDVVSDDMCTPCGPDQDTLGTMSTSPADCLCDPGYEGLLGNGTCTECSLGTYKPTLSNETCSPCNPGQITNTTGSTSSADCVCDAGYEPDGLGGCKACDAGFYKEDVSGNSCVACGTMYANTSTVTTGADSVNLCLCDIGYEAPDSDEFVGCIPCAKGSYKDTVADTSCILCGDNQDTQTSLSTSPSDCLCDPGYEDPDGDGNCTECSVGTYKSGLGNEACDACAANKTTNATGKLDSSSCVCILGHEPDGSGGCKLCDKDWFREELSAPSCIACSSLDAAFVTETTGSDNSSLCGCRAGFGSNGTECFACPFGSYKDVNGGAPCTPCGDNANTTGTNSTDQAHCLCNPGYYESGGLCLECDAGSYKSELGDEACTPCGSLKTTEAPRSIDNSSCVCILGYEPDGSGGCKPCDKDWFREELSAQSCTACSSLDAAFITLTTGSNSSSLCGCRAGFGTNGTECFACPFASYKDVDGGAPCTPCGDNANTTGTNSTDQAHCLCNPGYYESGGLCLECEIGSYKSELGDETCTACGSLKTTEASGNIDNSSCVCILGYEPDGSGGCKPCDKDWFREELSAPSCIACSSLDAAFITLTTGSNSSSLCGCRAGFGTNGTECFACPFGSYKDVGGGAPCTPCGDNANTTVTNSTDQAHCLCNPGYYEMGGSCLECGIGSYKLELGDEACTPCGSLKTTEETDNIDNSSCVCILGYELDGLGGCKPCDKDWFREELSAPSCTTCLSLDAAFVTGTTGSDNSSLCVCKAGFEGDADGCYACTLGSYKDYDGAGRCDSCKAKANTTGTNSTDSTDCLCNPGYYELAGDCVACDEGMYKPAPVNDACTPCGYMETTAATASINASACVCISGYELVDGNCSRCSVGSYKDQPGDESCTQCIGNRSTTDTGSTAATDCLCDSGYGEVDGNCTLCPIGFYKPDISNALCESCGSDKRTTTDRGSRVFVDCRCVPGRFGVDCELCLQGSYKSVIGNQECSLCRDGFITYDLGSTASSQCVAEPAVEEVKVFQRVITLDSTCHPDYQNLSSLRSQIMISRTQQSIKDSMPASSNFLACLILGLTCGSVVVDTELLFGSASDVNEAMVNTILEQSADEFLSYNLTLLDPGLVEIPKDDTGLGTAAIVVTIVASVFFAVLLMALVAWYYSRLREESRLKSLAEDTYNKSSKYYAYPSTYNTNYRMAPRVTTARSNTYASFARASHLTYYRPDSRGLGSRINSRAGSRYPHSTAYQDYRHPSRLGDKTYSSRPQGRRY